MVEDQDGGAVYLAENYLIDARWAYTSVNAYTIADGKLVALPDMFIGADRKIRNEIEFSFDETTRFNNIGYYLDTQPVYYFYSGNNELLVPAMGEETE